MVAKVLTIAPIGFDGHLIEVEGDSSKGLPSLQIVGLGNKAIDEAKERVKSAISNSYLEYPKQRLTINLAPAEMPKVGTHYDLPIALSILCSSGQIKQSELDDAVFAGELALNGDIRPIRGALSIADSAKRLNIHTIYLPTINALQATVIEGVEIIPVDNLKSLYLHLKKERLIPPQLSKDENSNYSIRNEETYLDDIIDQDRAKRALVIAAAGRHNILFTGPPGAGKTMLAKTLTSLLPPLNKAEQVEVTKIYGLAGEPTQDIIKERPFRSPHHTASRIAILGGGSHAEPGEISLSHLGVLFLDELPEYPRSVLESLRQPLEDRYISISRAGGKHTYPANIMLVATMNPCPCGYYGDPHHECTCSSLQISNYNKKISGPLIDRIDLVVHVSPVDKAKLSSRSLLSNQHKEALKMLVKARDAQNNRYGSSTVYNTNIKSKDISKYAPLSYECQQLLNKATDKLNLSARGYFKVIKVARTIADLEGSENITTSHLAEALQYRLNKNY